MFMTRQILSICEDQVLYAFLLIWIVIKRIQWDQLCMIGSFINKIQLFLGRMSKLWNFQSFSNQQCLNWSFKQSLSEDDQADNDQIKDQFNFSLEERLKKRQSHKNKYLNKIKQCLPEETFHTRKRKPTQSEISQDPSEFKRFKNRQAAKESRQRKKMYISLVEQQTKQLQNQIQQTNKEIQRCKLQIHKSNFNGNQSLSTFNRKTYHILKKIQKLIPLEESEDNNNEINLSIDSILYRFGPNGKERNANIREGFKQIISLCLPHINKYVAWSAKEKVHMFSRKQGKRLQQELWFSEFQHIVQQNLKGKESILQAKRVYITDKLQQILSDIRKLHLRNKQVSLLSSVVDNLFLQIRQILTPLQVSKFILFIQKYKYRQQFRYNEEIQFDKAHGQPRKHIKLQHAQEGEVFQ